MAPAQPTTYSKGEINRAGNEIRMGNPSDYALEIIDKWRASHAYILNTFQAILRNRTRKTKIPVAQRHKRMRTIADKLRRQPQMALARMDDIVGCRLIFPDIQSLQEFRENFHKAKFAHKRKNENNKYDYIAKPKLDGYRGIHDIYEYNVSSEKGQAHNGLLLELQYRTVYQHAWATTVEIIGMVTENQPKFHVGDKRHLEFFRLASEIIARAFENSTSCYPNLTNAELLEKFERIDNEIHIIRKLKGLNKSTAALGKQKNVILSLSEGGKLNIFTYINNNAALKEYFKLEKSDKNADIVLVKGNTRQDILLSYKSYFSDPNDFLNFINDGCERLSS